MSELFSRTLRSSKKDVEATSHDLLLRGGFIRPLASGIYTILPLGFMILKKIENIIRSEMNNIGGQEILMPVVNPADIWKESGRWHKIDSEMGRFNDRNGRDMVLAMTHEEVVADLVRNEVHSYKQLPKLIYHFQTKWRDDPRPRAGLIRVREFTMKDSYSLDRDVDGLEKQYQSHLEAYYRIFRRCGIETIAVQADLGIMGGLKAHEFIYPSEIGEDTILRCQSCGYSANRQIADFRRENSGEEPALPLEKVHTPGAATIDDLANYLNLNPKKMAKARFLIATTSEGDRQIDSFILALIRGDLEVNETKIATALGAGSLRPATEAEIRDHGIEPGFGSPLGANSLTLIVDESIPGIPNMVAGANEPDYHYKNVNYERDLKADIVTDIALVEDGFSCKECGKSLETTRGIEVGNIFQLGTYYSEKMNCSYLDADGVEKPVVMGSYGIGLGRLLACIAEAHNDEYGLVWPKEVAPFDVHIVDLIDERDRGISIYRDLEGRGFQVLYDDRDERAGVKFNDADLIGIPLRLTIGKRSLDRGGVELKVRKSGENKFVALDHIGSEIAEYTHASLRSVM